LLAEFAELRKDRDRLEARVVELTAENADLIAEIAEARASLAAADAVEGDRPSDECEHVYSYTSVDGRWFCADCTPDGGIEPSREAYNDLREAAEDRIIELEDQAKAAEARVVELAEALHKAADALYEAHEYIVDDMGGTSGFGRVADRYRALAAAGEGEE
jgi:chaperonin cofactor prefoldin